MSLSYIKETIDYVYSLSRMAGHGNHMGLIIDMLKKNGASGNNADNPEKVLLNLLWKVHKNLNFNYTTFILLGKLAETIPLHKEKSFVQQLDNIFGKINFSDAKDDKGEPDKIFKEWQKNGVLGLNDRLSLIVKSARYDTDMNYDYFVGEFGQMTVEEQQAFVVKSEKFMQKGISPGILMANEDALTQEADLSKNGLDMFEGMETKKRWLTTIVSGWLDNPNSIAINHHFFDGVLVPKVTKTITKKEYNLPNIKGISDTERGVIEEDVNDELGYEGEKTQITVPNEELRAFALDILKEKLEIFYEQFKEETLIEVYRHLNAPEIRAIIESMILRKIDDGDYGGSLKIIKGTNFDIKNEALQQKLVYQTTKELSGGKAGNCYIPDLLETADLFCMSESSIAEIDNAISVYNGDMSSSVILNFIGNIGSHPDMENKFPKIYHKIIHQISQEIGKNLDIADYFLENLDKYCKQQWVAENISKAITHYSVAQKFIIGVEGYGEQAEWKDEPWVAGILAEAKKIVEEYHKNFPQYNGDDDDYYDGFRNEGFRDHDQFENHPWRFGGKQIKMAVAISRLMNGESDDKALESLGINGQEIFPVIEKINMAVRVAFERFLAQARSNSNINEEDKNALIYPEAGSVKMTPLIDDVCSLVARYLVQKYKGDVNKLNHELGNKNRQEEVVTDENDKDWSGNYPRGEALLQDIQSLLNHGFEKYIKAYEVDIPLYDKLYAEFDNLRETGRNPLEVYLGRDGIYAYVGRRAQDVARRRKMGLEGRKKLRDMGEVVEINPNYMVYPRYFRDNLDYETKREFLAQEGISPDADPLFYDTGYTGTIPEQIMKIMDFDSEDIEKRIRLLSARTTNRRVKGIPENARSEIVEYIEHNSKLDSTAVGLMKDLETGKIRPIAEPTSPFEQFEYMMIKQAISRHYWLKEKLHHEPSGNMNLDSEHYTIRVRQEYARILPQDFIKDPKEFLKTQGELLKGSKGEGEFPNEEITLFKMTDGTEIVAKKIELKKAKEARKEFSILISAKKAGLPTAEPVGFVSGKEEGDGSYLLMKKIEGLSGRNFDKYLQSTGKFDEEKIKSILKIIADKNREMAKLFRTTLGIDKRWRTKDTIIEFNEETGEVGSVIPIDWERAESYNPSKPKEIDEING